MKWQKKLKEREKGIMKSQKKTYIIFALLVVVQLLTIMYCFQFRKEGTHVDEPWSYGYANGFYTREIFMDDEKKPININTWLDGKHLWDYLVVNEGEQFRFDSVYYNKQNDISPFLHSMILHAICSFFPESFSFWYSFAINIVSFVVCMIFLFKTAQMLKNDTFALGCCFIYGFSLAARDTYIYLRMYAMSTAIIMVYIYFTLKYVKAIQENKKPAKSLLPILIAVAWIGFMTNFYNISFVGITTFLICIYLLGHKKIKQMFAYGFSMLASLGAALVFMPNLFARTGAYGEEVAATGGFYTFSMQLKLFLNFFLKKFCNIAISLYPSPVIPIIAGVMVYVLILLIPVVVLVRREPFALKIFAKLKYMATHKREMLKRFLNRINWMYVIFFLVVILQILVVCKTAKVEQMGVYADRYIFFLYPIVALLGSLCVYSIVQALFKKSTTRKCVMVILMLGFVCLNMYSRYAFSLYLFPTNTKGESIAEAVEGNNCIFISSDITRIVSISNRLMYCNSYFQTFPDEYQDYTSEYTKKLSDGPLMLIVAMEDFETMEEKIDNLGGNDIVKDKVDMELNKDTPYYTMLRYFEDLVPESEMQLVSSEVVFTKGIRVFVINP